MGWLFVLQVASAGVSPPAQQQPHEALLAGWARQGCSHVQGRVPVGLGGREGTEGHTQPLPPTRTAPPPQQTWLSPPQPLQSSFPCPNTPHHVPPHPPSEWPLPHPIPPPSKETPCLPHLHVDELPWPRQLQEELNQRQVPILHGQVQNRLAALYVLGGQGWEGDERRMGAEGDQILLSKSLGSLPPPRPPVKMED